MTNSEPNLAASSSPKQQRRTFNVALFILLYGWVVLLLPLTHWGLPSSKDDAYLFPARDVWPPERYDVEATLQAREERAGGADTDLNPRTSPDRIVHLTPDHAARAEILRRYRLFSRQPDEMITFMALQRMRPGAFDFDPRLYQYGGGYIYLVGAALGVTSVLGITELTSDAGYYLANPDAFARFYVVARALSLFFGALTLWAVYRLARRSAGVSAGYFALGLVMLSPVFITASLEAKPHLASACLILWSIDRAIMYLQRPTGRRMLGLALGAGYAFSLVLTGLAALLLFPTLWLLRRRDWKRILFGLAGAITVYVVTNPYIPYNALFRPEALGSNLGNSTAMYAEQLSRAAAGQWRVAELLAQSIGPGVAIIGLAALPWLWWRHPRETALAFVPGAALLLLAVALAAGKPAEFARFLLVPSLLLCVSATAALFGLLRHGSWPAKTAPLIIALFVYWVSFADSGDYYHAFRRDASIENESRHQAARHILDTDDAFFTRGLPVMAVLQEPAPYAVPPLDFARREFYLLPPNPPADLESAELPSRLVFTADDLDTHRGAWWHRYYAFETRFPEEEEPATPISWANKPVFIYHKRPARP